MKNFLNYKNSINKFSFGDDFPNIVTRGRGNGRSGVDRRSGYTRKKPLLFTVERIEKTMNGGIKVQDIS